jgi:ribosomal protein S6
MDGRPERRSRRLDDEVRLKQLMARKYDATYIFAGTAKDDVLDKQVEKMRGEITRLGGTVLNVEIAGKRTFARPMAKRDHGVYVRVRFELDPAHIATLRERYHLIEDLFRFQILSVDERREAVITEQKAKRKAHDEAVHAAALAGGGVAVEPVEA